MNTRCKVGIDRYVAGAILLIALSLVGLVVADKVAITYEFWQLSHEVRRAHEESAHMEEILQQHERDEQEQADGKAVEKARNDLKKLRHDLEPDVIPDT